MFASRIILLSLLAGTAFAQDADSSPSQQPAATEQEPAASGSEDVEEKVAPTSSDEAAESSSSDDAAAPTSEEEAPPTAESPEVETASSEAGTEATEEAVDLPTAAPKKKKKKGSKVSAIFTERMEIRYWDVPEVLPGFEDRGDLLNYIEEVNRFTAFIRGGAWSMFGQIDQVALIGNSYFLDDERFFKRDLLSPGTFNILIPGQFDPATQGTEGWDLFSRNNYINLEKIRVGYQKGAVSLSLGDSYAAFGSGMALNLNRNVDIDIDTSIQGAQVVWQPGAWEVQALFGQANRQQVWQDNPNAGLYGDRRHMIGALRLHRYGIGPASVGAYGVVYNFTDEEGLEAGFQNIATTPEAVVAGGNFEIFGVGPTDWYFEGAGFAYPGQKETVVNPDGSEDVIKTSPLFLGGEPKPGYALYLSSTIYAGKTTWLVEGKRYYNAERVNAMVAPELYKVAIAPTLEYERAITEDSAAETNSNDIWATRIRMDWQAPVEYLVPYASVAVFRDLDTAGLHFNRVPETIVHPMLGFEWTPDAFTILTNLGYRVDIRDKDPEDPNKDWGADRQLHGDVLAKVPIMKDWYLDLSLAGEWYRWGNNLIQQNDYVEVETAWSVQKGGILALTWFMDYSDNPLIGSAGNLTPTLYGAGEIQVKPTPDLTLKAFYGAYKAGIRCSGGQCRVLPGFNGARLTLQGTF